MNTEIKFDEKRMTLIVKPTEACNFSCTFCSSTELVSDKRARLGIDKIISFLERYPKTGVIFVVGGDPLMMPVEYYTELIAYLDSQELPAKISLTTNLWDFYKKPEKWRDLFLHPRIEIGTSFQYGEGRQIKPGVVFTEEIFTDVVRVYREHVPGRELCFLAVIDDDNEHLALNHVYLAKHLNMQCRLVYASKSGRSGKPYPISKLYKIFVQIWKLGLAEYEQTALTISDKFLGIEVACPLSRNCDQHMRSLNPDGRYFTCGPLNDDLDVTNEIDFESEVMRGENFYTPLQLNTDLQVLKNECFGCKMFQICNACRKHIKDLKSSDMVEEHCSVMKSISGDIVEMAQNEDILNLKREVEYAR
jgi:sulfatase maturation enzyme AslB (radical SAM superfamily)